MPVWHKATHKWVEEGKLAVIGLTQEQHGDRCRLFAQWQQFDWPIAWDPINVMESAAVPIVVAIDEHGIVRAVRPRPETFEVDFLNKDFGDDAPESRPRALGTTSAPELTEVRRRAKQDGTAAVWRELGDALVLWGGPGRIDDAIHAYNRSRGLDPRDANTLFRLGVGYRIRYDSDASRSGDFQKAIDFWEQALHINPNQYIWRRRIQQFGPRLDKPYPFYDWTEQARREILARGDAPVTLAASPYGAEIAEPARSFDPAREDTESPDVDGRIQRDRKALIQTEVTVVRSRVRPGGTARVHVTLRPNSLRRARVWNPTPRGPAMSWPRGSAR